MISSKKYRQCYRRARVRSYFFKWAKLGLFLFIFVLFNITNIAQIFDYESTDGVLGTQTRGGRMVIAYETTKQWRNLILILPS